MFEGSDRRIVNALRVGASVVFCAAVFWLDIHSASDVTAAFLYSLALIAIYPVKRNWATLLIATLGVGLTVLGAVLGDRGESWRASLLNRSMIVTVVAGIAYLLNRVNEAERLLTRVATRDPLTGVPNRGQLMALLGREQQRAERYRTSFSLLMLDIDHFKRVNDSYGHQTGDEVIKAMATAAAKDLRPTDFIGRFGGEEFIIALPHTDERGAVVTAERIRDAVSKIAIPAGDQMVRVTVSIGVATYAATMPVEQVIAAADRGLYAAKSGGRDRVAIGRLSDPPATGGTTPTRA
jgi:diguanylate cyclase (GGDEF)-like protein